MSVDRVRATIAYNLGRGYSGVVTENQVDTFSRDFVKNLYVMGIEVKFLNPKQMKSCDLVILAEENGKELGFAYNGEILAVIADGIGGERSQSIIACIVGAYIVARQEALGETVRLTND